MMYHQYRPGYIEVISGCMFAGKTEELIRRVKVLEFAKQRVLVFKPVIDNRYSKDEVVSHAGSSVPSIVVNSATEILPYVQGNADVIAIDEAQFFDESLTLVCDQAAAAGKRVMVAGLDTDFRGEPFPVMAKLLATSEFVTKLTAVCTACGAPATRTQRMVNGKPARYDDPIVLVGASERYEARCRHHHQVIGKPQLPSGEVNHDE